METNNGAESQNKMLKYSYIPRRRNINLSQLVDIVITDFLPDSHQKYLFQNYKMNSQYRRYSDKIPAYLHGRPRPLIEHCLKSKERAEQQFTAKSILEEDIVNGKFLVSGQSGQKYNVDFGKETGKLSCTCQHWINTNFPCKHFFLVFRLRSNWNWSSLPQCYLESPYLSADKNALSKGLMDVPDKAETDDVTVHDDIQDNEFERDSDTKSEEGVSELPARVSIIYYSHSAEVCTFLLLCSYYSDTKRRKSSSSKYASL